MLIIFFFLILGISSSRSLSRKGSMNFSLSPEEKPSRKAEVKSENQSLLGAVEPLDWLFSADSEPEPPSSPKLVNVSYFIIYHPRRPWFTGQYSSKVKIQSLRDVHILEL